MTKEEAIKQLEHERDFSREMEACWAKVDWGDRPKHITDPMVMSARHKRIADALDMAISALKSEVTPVVHCKDCKHRGTDDCPMYFEEDNTYTDDDGHREWDWTEHDHTHDDGFCDRGERKE